MLGCVASLPLVGQVSVLTYQYDTTRAGANANESILTRANVNASSFGKLATFPVDGYVYAQPLYIPAVNISGAGPRNVLLVATEHDSVYAFDADLNSTAALWRVSFLNSGATTISAAETGCNHIVPEIGISSTPVVDASTGTVYVLASTKESGAFVHRLHALDLASGSERQGSPVVIQGSVGGSGDGGSTVTFNPRNYKQRMGLLLLNGVVYVGFSSHCDIGPYHGWLMGYDARTLQQVSVYNTTPNGSAAALWQAGAAPAADAAGNIYIVSGNGTFDAANGGIDLGESVVKLSPGLKVQDWFAPYNAADLNDQDLDLGSAGVVLLPDEAGSPAHPHLLASAGKQGRVYLIDRDNLGHWRSGSDSQIPAFTDAAPVFGNMAYFNGFLYVCGGGNFLRQYPVRSGAFGAPVMSKFQYDSPCVPGISANGQNDAIVWTLDRSNSLRAYDASNVANELYDSNMNASRDTLGSYVKYSVPTIVNGRVYAGTQNSVVAYGLLNGAVVKLAIANAASGQPSIAAPGSLITIKGPGLSQSTESASGFPLPQTLGGASVSIGNLAAPLIYASPDQLTAQVPFETPTGSTTVAVTLNGTVLSSASLTVQTEAPGLFLSSGTQAAVVNASGTVNSPSQPAEAQSAVAAYLTGLGAVDNPVATGQAAPLDRLSQTTRLVTATIGGQGAQVLFAGLAPGFAGVYQVNLVVPSLPAGDYPLQIFIAGIASNTATISVH